MTPRLCAWTALLCAFVLLTGCPSDDGPTKKRTPTPTSKQDMPADMKPAPDMASPQDQGADMVLELDMGEDMEQPDMSTTKAAAINAQLCAAAGTASNSRYRLTQCLSPTGGAAGTTTNSKNRVVLFGL